MKFGGTSMGSAERIRVAAEICAEQMEQRPVVAVVSAMSKVTDLLLDTLRKAEAGDDPGHGSKSAGAREPAPRSCLPRSCCRGSAQAGAIAGSGER